MIFVIDKLCNFLIYIFLIHFCWKINFRSKWLPIFASIFSCLVAGFIDNMLGDTKFSVYIVWALISMILLFKDNILHLSVLTICLTWFMGMLDTFSVIIVQIILLGTANSREQLEEWQLTAYVISISLEYLWYHFILKRNNVYMDDIAFIYKVTMLLMTLIFEMVVVNVFSLYYENPSDYNWYLHVRFGLCLIGTVYAITTTLKLAVKNCLFDRQNKELKLALKMQQNQYQYQKENTLSLRRFRHDLINHIGAIQEYLAMEQYDNAQNYINDIWNVADDLAYKINTGDDSLDAILNYYCYMFEKANIIFEVSGKIVRPLEIEMLDLTTLIGNALQNAMEATLKAKEKRIKVEIIDLTSEIFISIYNTFELEIISSKFWLETSKKDKINHGYGLKNIKSIVEKYNGEYYVSIDNIVNGQLFKLDISLPRGVNNDHRNL